MNTVDDVFWKLTHVTFKQCFYPIWQWTSDNSSGQKTMGGDTIGSLGCLKSLAIRRSLIGYSWDTYPWVDRWRDN